MGRVREKPALCMERDLRASRGFGHLCFTPGRHAGMAEGGKKKGGGKGGVPECVAAVSQLRKRIAAEAELIVQEKMPAKVAELTRLIEENELFMYPEKDDSIGPVQYGEGQGASKKRKVENASPRRAGESDADKALGDAPPYVKSDIVFECNETVLKQQAIVKKEIQDCLEMLSKVKIWIQLNIPKVEDGNNFGVSIQEESVNDLAKAEDTSFSLLDGINKYFMTRGKLVSRLGKYPGVKDYTVCIQEVDRRERVNLCLSLQDLRNNYFILWDSITKNLDKIKKPRSSVEMPFS